VPLCVKKDSKQNYKEDKEKCKIRETERQRDRETERQRDKEKCGFFMQKIKKINLKKWN
jgi:hypothetical protein